MLRITHPRPEPGRQTAFQVEFVDGVASVESLHPERELALTQHGFTVEEIIDVNTMSLARLREYAKARGLRLPKNTDREHILWMLSTAPEPDEAG